ncbi:cation diffusion facilitator family transporter [Solicola sp. PLA-1-18]|uniref:cation diffusion facilitator family transporter n=1 Tax=Solicola sp. PLA-1-18 TaxID=3380532 RepID=UPI003B8064F2
MGHDHDHAPQVQGAHQRRRLAIVLGITATIMVVEIVGAVLTGSLALLADAGHMLTDAAGLAMALTVAHLTLRPPTARRTWGLARAETIGAAVQALLLLAVGLYVLVEGIRRLFEPGEVASTGMIVFGVIGLAGNAVGIWLLASSRGSNLNMRAAFLEVLNDTLGSVAVIVAAIVIATTGWTRADAIVSLLIAALIVPRTLMLLRDSGRVLLEATPAGLDLDDVRSHVLALPHVREIHDLHASQIATGLPILSAHVVVDDECFYDGHLQTMLDDLQACVVEHFDVSVEHSTFQFESIAHADHESVVHP